MVFSVASSTKWDPSGETTRHQEVSRWIARVLLFALAFCLPFETPLFPLGPLVVTSVELILYLSIIGWVATLALAVGDTWVAAPARVRAALADVARDPIARAVGLWLAVTAVSAAAAPSYRTAALKFALRTLSGGLLYFAARDLMRPHLHARRLVLALLAGAVASASLTLLETVRPEWTAWWRPFRTQEFSANGLTRASSTFAFPNIAAMYWEASIPLVLTVAIGRNGNKPTRRRTLLVVLLSGLLVHGILATASRAALAGAVLSAGALLVVGKSKGLASSRAVRVAIIGILATEMVLIAAALSPGQLGSPFRQRLLPWVGGGSVVPQTTADSSLADDAGPGSDARPMRKVLWTAAVRLWRAHPLLGVGPDNFRRRYPEVITADGHRPMVDERLHANNLYLETLADLGLAGATVLVLLAFGVWLRGRAALTLSADSLGLVSFVAVGTFFVHGFVDYFFEFTPTFGLWWLLLALLSRPAHPGGAAARTITPG
jgi:O-antigen ligase